MDRISNNDLQHALARLVRTMDSAGLPTEHLHLQHGSPSAGIAFRLYLLDPATGSLGTVPGMFSSGFLGATKQQAYDALQLLATGIDMVRFGRVGA